MPMQFSHLIRQSLLANRIWLDKATPEDRIRAFMAATRPVSTNRPLVRLGGDTDGGYLLPDDLQGIEVCFSPGVSNVATFEEDLAGRGIRCFLADYSVDAPPVSNDLFDFEKKYLGPSDTDMFMTLDSWVKRKAPGTSDSILQMDIEGAEYGVIYEASAEVLRRFRILIIEFHRLETLYDRMGFEMLSLTFGKLLRDFEVVHIHPNNCAQPVNLGAVAIPPIMEFTFLRRDRITSRVPAGVFPHPLDKTNVPDRPDFALPACWYR
jgi:hypothetical protein